VLDHAPELLSADLVHRQIALLAGGEFFERHVVPFREAVAIALDYRITESVSKVALLAAALTLGRRH
jgi:hypothetical protein